MKSTYTLAEFVIFAEAINNGYCSGILECKKFAELNEATAFKAFEVIQSRGGNGAKLVRIAWLTVVQALLALGNDLKPKLKTVAEHLENPDLIKPAPVYKIHRNPSEAAKIIYFGVIDSMASWNDEELSQCEAAEDKWFAYIASGTLTTR